MLKIGVVGTRTFKDYQFLSEQLDLIRAFLGDFLVVSGGATGADTMAVRWANERKLPIPVVFPAYFYDLSHPDAVIKEDRNGRKYDAAAGLRRNQEIVDNSDLIVAFWDGKSPGTKDTIGKAQQALKSIYVLWPATEPKAYIEERVYGTR